MCGVAGIWRFGGRPADGEVVDRMLDTISYRGPDDRGRYCSGSFAAGCVRLSILDLSRAGHQPFETTDRQGVLVYNGELYNYVELRERLQVEGVEFRSKTDSEVVLYALHHWGAERAIRTFEGMFGFAYFDCRRRALWLARDRLGIKPLYIARTPDALVFASEIKAILACSGVQCEPDMLALSTHIVHEYVEESWTPFRGIEALLPGGLCMVKDDSLRTMRYFDVVRDLDLDKLRAAKAVHPDKHAAEFERLFSRCVSTHLMSDAPVATLCSGGVDSSLVTACARETKSDVVAYVANVEGARPEAQKARSVGKHLGIEVRSVDYSSEEYLRDWPVAVWHGDQPPCYASDQAFLAVAKACRRDGIKVVLTGEGADELYGGYPWQANAFAMWRMRRRQSRAGLLRAPFNALNRLFSFFCPVSRSTLMERTFSRFPTPEPYGEFQMLRSACAMDGGQRWRRQRALFEKLDGELPEDEIALVSVCLNDMYGHLATLLHRNDRMGMAASIESRVPFLDNHMIDFAMHLPANCKIQRGTGKWIVKEAASRALPKAIVHARKIGFSVSRKPYQHGIPLIQNGMVPDLFRWTPEVTAGLLEELSGRPHVLFTIIGVELWARLFLRRERPEEIGETLVKSAVDAGAVVH